MQPSNVSIENSPSTHVDKNAILLCSDNRRIIIKEGSVIEGGAVIIANERDCIVSNSFIGSRARIRNSIVEHVYAGSGSQILETTLPVDAPCPNDEHPYSVRLEPGLDHTEENFAFFRGGVIKRIPDLRIRGTVTVPTGHSLISRSEYLQLKAKNARMNSCQLVENAYVMINSQYSHREPWEQWYDPALFGEASFYRRREEVPIDGTECIIDLLTISKMRAQTDGAESARIADLREQANRCARVLFKSPDGFLLVQR